MDITSNDLLPIRRERLIGDEAYDRDALEEQMMSGFATELIAPIVKVVEMSERPGMVERCDVLSSLESRTRVCLVYNFRRLVVLWEYHTENFLGFVHLGCAIILLS